MKLFWKFYAFLFFAIALSNALQIFGKNSLLVVYYNTLIVFGNWFLLPYFFNVLSALINLIVSAYIFAFAFDIEGMPKPTPWLFYARLLTDCLGHSYGLKTIQAGFAQGELAGFSILLSLILPVMPSYWALWKMIMTQEIC